MAVAMQTEDFPCLPSGLAEVNKMIKEHGDLFSDSQCKVCSAVLNSESQKLTHYQSKKHANKVRRYLSIANEKEPAFKKLKASVGSDVNKGDRYKACHVCNMTFSAPVVAESHYNGKVHAKNLRLKAVGPQSPVASQTPQAFQPRKKVADDLSVVSATGGGGGAVAGGNGSGGNNNNNNNSTTDDNNPDRFCSICQASFNNPLMAQQHYMGKKHRKQTTKMKLMETYGPSTTPGSKSKGYPCAVCKIMLNSVEQYQSHISGAKHKNQIKKSGLSSPENQQVADEDENQVAGGDGDQFTALFDPATDKLVSEDDQYPATDDQYPAVDDQYPAADDQYPAADDQYTAGDDQYTADNDPYPPGDDHFTEHVNQYTPEDTQYSEYQYT